MLIPLSISTNTTDRTKPFRSLAEETKILILPKPTVRLLGWQVSIYIRVGGKPLPYDKRGGLVDEGYPAF